MVTTPVTPHTPLRAAFTAQLLKEGWSPEGPAPHVAWAVPPFDSFPIPPRRLEKAVRRRARKLAKDLKSRGRSQLEESQSALAAVRDYIAMAQEFEADAFLARWNELETGLSDKIAQF